MKSLLLPYYEAFCLSTIGASGSSQSPTSHWVIWLSCKWGNQTHQTDIQVESQQLWKMLFLGQQKTLDGALPKKPPKMVWSEDDPFPWGPTCGMAFLQELWKKFKACIVELAVSVFSSCTRYDPAEVRKGVRIPSDGRAMCFLFKASIEMRPPKQQDTITCAEREREMS